MIDWAQAVSWTDAIGAVASIFTVLGVGLVIVQMFMLRKAVRRDASARLSEQSLSILAFIGERPDLYPYLYQAKPHGTLSSDKQAALFCVCEMIANYAEMMIEEFGAFETPEQKCWRAFFFDTLAKSPAFREFLARHSHWYSSRLNDEVVRSGVALPE